nr:unnamed protein product [Spirometra erinaceieuropaei]
MDHLTELFQEMWRQGEVPQDFKDATIVHLYKRKGNRQVCDNHRGISLLNIAGKIFARILPNRLNNHLEQGLLPESQCGFRRHRGTTNMIFAARQLQEKCREMRTHLCPTFVVLTKTLDMVNREGMWKIMQQFGCPERFIQMVRQLNDGMMARVTDHGAVTDVTAHGPLLLRLRELRSGHQHAEDGGHASTATQHSHFSLRAENQCERSLTASGGELPVPGQYPLP